VLERANLHGESSQNDLYGVEPIAFNFTMLQLRGILQYKRKAEEQKLPGIPNCKAADVQRQVEWFCYGTPYTTPDDEVSKVNNVSFTDYDCTVKERAQHLPYKGID
jgi:hypothetical protein